MENLNTFSQIAFLYAVFFTCGLCNQFYISQYRIPEKLYYQPINNWCPTDCAHNTLIHSIQRQKDFAKQVNNSEGEFQRIIIPWQTILSFQPINSRMKVIRVIASIFPNPEWINVLVEINGKSNYKKILPFVEYRISY